jgi:hypothetical protein
MLLFGIVLKKKNWGFKLEKIGCQSIIIFLKEKYPTGYQLSLLYESVNLTKTC